MPTPPRLPDECRPLSCAARQARALQLVAERAEYIEYHDREGTPGPRRRRHLRAAMPGGLPVGPLVAHDPEEAETFAPRSPLRIEAVAALVPTMSMPARRRRYRRNPQKIEAAIGNARAALGVIEARGSLASLFWEFQPERPAVRPASDAGPRSLSDIPAETPGSRALARELQCLAFASSARPSPTRTCRRPASSTTHVVGCCVRDGVERASSSSRATALKRNARLSPAAAPALSPSPLG